MFGLSGGEIFLIALIALILFGNEKLPENLKKMFKGINKAKKLSNDIQSSWIDIRQDIEKSVNYVQIKKELNSVVSQDEIDFYQRNLLIEESVALSNQDPNQENIAHTKVCTNFPKSE